jgi:hypothetical protein
MVPWIFSGGVFCRSFEFGEFLLHPVKFKSSDANFYTNFPPDYTKNHSFFKNSEISETNLAVSNILI